MILNSSFKDSYAITLGMYLSPPVSYLLLFIKLSSCVRMFEIEKVIRFYSSGLLLLEHMQKEL